jgi:manganese/zinc/iron transport system substrate-binding protein
MKTITSWGLNSQTAGVRHSRHSAATRWRILVGAGLMLACCVSAWGAPKSYPYQVTTTVGMVTDIVRQVAGDKAKVTGIMGAGVDPHLYKPTRDDVASMMRADVIFYSGLMLEGKMADTLIKIARTKPVHAVTESIEEKFLLEPEEMQGHYDPHVWMDPMAWAKAVEAVGRALAEYDPANAEHYRRNAAGTVQRCEELAAYGQSVLSTVPESSRVLISSHDAFNYFGRAFGLKVMGVQGLSTESEAGLQRINELVDYIVQQEVRAVFVESSVSPRNIEALVQGVQSRGQALRIGGELYSDAMGAEGTYEGTYLGMLDHNITIVARALGGQAPERGWQGKLSAHR